MKLYLKGKINERKLCTLSLKSRILRYMNFLNNNKKIIKIINDFLTDYIFNILKYT